MAYKRKPRQSSMRYFDEDDFDSVKRTCKRYVGLMDGLGLEGMNVQWSSIQRFDIMCTAPAGIAGNIREDICTEMSSSPFSARSSVGDATIRDCGNGRCRVQIPVFPR